jgi:hypothetical protein
MPTLTKATGVKFEVSKQLENDVLLLHVENKPLDEVMRKLAEADSAEWEAAGEGFRLTRSTRLIEQLRKERHAHDVEQLRERLGPMLDSVRVTLTSKKFAEMVKESTKIREKFDSEDTKLPKAERVPIEKRLRELDSLFPTCRLLGAVLAEIGVDALADIPIGERVVWSNRPTSVQRALSRKSMLALARFPSEHAFSVTELIAMMPKSEIPPDSDLNELKKYASAVYGSAFITVEMPSPQEGERPLGAPDRMLVVIRRDGGADYSIQINATDARNRKVLSVTADSLFADREYEEPEMPEGSGKPVQPGGEPVVQWSPISRLLLKEEARIQGADSSIVQPAKRQPADPALVDWLVNPEINEPLSMGATDVLLAAAKHKSVNVAACVPDVLAWYERYFDTAAMKVSDISDYLTKGHDLFADVKDGWLITRPNWPLDEQEARIDRGAMGNLLRIIARDGISNLEAESVYLTRTTSSAFPMMTLAPARLLGGGRGNLPGSPRPELLRLYGMMTPAQKKKLAGGNLVTFAELNAPQRRQASHIIYQDPEDDEYRGAPAFGSGDTSNTAMEPTDLAPNGLFASLGIRARVISQPLIYLVDPLEIGRQQSMMVLMPDQTPKREEGMNYKVPVAGWDKVLAYVRTRSGMQIDVDICVGTMVSAKFYERMPPYDKAPVPISELPASVRQYVLNEIKWMRDHPRPIAPVDPDP